MTVVKSLILIAVAVLLSAGNVQACKCARATQEFGYAAKNSPLVFSGQLVSVTDEEKTGTIGAYSIRVFKFVPDKIWRGTKADTITLISGNNNCNETLGKGRYVIYTDPSRDLVSCNRIVANNIEKEAMKLDRLFTKKRFKKLQAAG